MDRTLPQLGMPALILLKWFFIGQFCACRCFNFSGKRRIEPSLVMKTLSEELIIAGYLVLSD